MDTNTNSENKSNDSDYLFVMIKLIKENPSDFKKSIIENAIEYEIKNKKGLLKEFINIKNTKVGDVIQSIIKNNSKLKNITKVNYIFSYNITEYIDKNIIKTYLDTIIEKIESNQIDYTLFKNIMLNFMKYEPSAQFYSKLIDSLVQTKSYDLISMLINIDNEILPIKNKEENQKHQKHQIDQISTYMFHNCFKTNNYILSTYILGSGFTNNCFKPQCELYEKYSQIINNTISNNILQNKTPKDDYLYNFDNNLLNQINDNIFIHIANTLTAQIDFNIEKNQLLDLCINGSHIDESDINESHIDGPQVNESHINKHYTNEHHGSCFNELNKPIQKKKDEPIQKKKDEPKKSDEPKKDDINKPKIQVSVATKSASEDFNLFSRSINHNFDKDKVNNMMICIDTNEHDYYKNIINHICSVKNLTPNFIIGENKLGVTIFRN